jgi:hypothetical protein
MKNGWGQPAFLYADVLIPLGDQDTRRGHGLPTAVGPVFIATKCKFDFLAAKTIIKVMFAKKTITT